MRRTLILQPGRDGIVRDQPAHLIPANAAVDIRNAVWEEGRLRSRWGLSQVAAITSPLHIMREEFPYTGQLLELVSAPGGDIHDITNGRKVAQSMYPSANPRYLFRTMYRGESIWCDQSDDSTPMVRIMGAAPDQNDPIWYVTTQWTTGKRIVDLHYANAGGNSTTPRAGMYLWRGRFRGIRIVDFSGTTATIEHTWMGPSDPVPPSPTNDSRLATFGFTWPTVPVYEEGTVSGTPSGLSGATVTGTGVRFTGGSWGEVIEGDILVTKPSSGRSQAVSVSVTNPTTLSASLVATQSWSDSLYAIQRACPFKDVVVFKESLVGTGVAQRPNRVYFSPPGWDMSTPPGFVPPVDLSNPTTSNNPDDFSFYWMDVPAPHHGDPNVALASSPHGVYVLKRKAVYLVTGSYPNFAQQLVANGAGCSDIRSVQHLPFGRVWAGEDGVFLADDEGEIRDLTNGRINKWWRSLTASGDYGPTKPDHIAIGEVGGVILVSISSNAGADQVLLTYDVSEGTWTSRWTGTGAMTSFYVAKVAGESERLYGVDTDGDEVMDFTTAVKGGQGRTPPEEGFALVTGDGIAQAAGVEGEALIGDIAIHAGAQHDELVTPGPEIKATVHHADGVRHSAMEQKGLSPIESSPEDAGSMPDAPTVRRHDMRVNRSGRRIQLTVEADADALDVELGEVVIDMFDAPAGT